MAPGDDPESGRIARERLQASVGQIASSGVTAPSEELVAERDRAQTADAEAYAAREALAVEREARVEAELAARTASDQLKNAEQALAAATEKLDQLAVERDAAAARAAELDASLGAVGDHQHQLDEELAAARERAERAEAELAEAIASGNDDSDVARDLESLRAAYADLQAAGQDAEAARERYGEDLANALADQQDLQRLFDEAVASREETARELEGLRERFDRAAKELEEERARGEWLGVELQAAQNRERDAGEALEDADLRRRQLEHSLESSTERAEALAAEVLELRTTADVADETYAELDSARERAEAAELALADARAHTATISEQLALAQQTLASADERLSGEQARFDEIAADAERRIADAEARAAAAEIRAAEAAEALSHAGETTHAEAAELRTELTAAHLTIEELQAALSAERTAREALAHQLAQGSLTTATSIALPEPEAPSSSLPPLEVAAEQARQFAHAAAATDSPPPPGVTDEALAKLDEQLERATSVRSAGKAAVTAMAAATGWIGGVVWEPKDDDRRVFTCAETWVAYGTELHAWETMAWRAHLEDGLVPAAAGSGASHWADTEEMLACPRSRSADWAGLGTLTTLPVVTDDGEVLAVLELVRTERGEADEALLGGLMSLARRLATRLVAINETATEATHTGRM
jgi:ParB family chromosome partitioning protein